MPGTSPGMKKCSGGLLDAENQSAATLLDFLAARSRSMTARQPVLRSARCLYMQAVVLGVFGISSLPRGKRWPGPICGGPAAKAEPAAGDSPGKEPAEGKRTSAPARVVAA